MESRTRLAVGGMTTVAASVAVICAVALTNSMALSHSDAAAIPAAKVVVPASATPVARQTPAPSPTAVAAPVVESEPETVTEGAPVAEVVPAPAPVVVAPSAPAAPQVPAVRPGSVSDDDAIAEAERSGSWDEVREWAKRWGWSDERIDAWIAKLEQARHRFTQDGNRTSDGDRWYDDDRLDEWWDSSVDEHSPKDRPARAGANAGDGSTSTGEKKGRSPGHPGQRDR